MLVKCGDCWDYTGLAIYVTLHKIKLRDQPALSEPPSYEKKTNGKIDARFNACYKQKLSTAARMTLWPG